MTTYMYGEDPAEAMESAAARERFREWVHGGRDLPRTHWQYRSQPWGVRGRAEPLATVHSAPPQAIDQYSATPTTGITPRTLEMLREIKDAVRTYDRAVLDAMLERDRELAAIQRKYLP